MPLSSPDPGPPFGPPPPGRAGASLVELLTAAALSLVVMGAVASLFSVFARSVSEGQATVELHARMRNAAWRLRQDLVGLTCVPAPRVRVEANSGYFHVIEGPSATSALPAVLIGDIDDVLALTTSSPGSPFTGRLAGARGFESPTAEVVWFCEASGQQHRGQTLYNLHRRQLLVAATPDAGSFAADVFAARGDSDLSYSADASTPEGPHANSLGDLSKQANRFLTVNGANRKLTGAREGEDVILGDRFRRPNLRRGHARRRDLRNQGKWGRYGGPETGRRGPDPLRRSRHRPGAGAQGGAFLRGELI
jgi:hypothetical protein